MPVTGLKGLFQIISIALSNVEKNVELLKKRKGRGTCAYGGGSIKVLTDLVPLSDRGLRAGQIAVSCYLALILLSDTVSD